jgi:hypothetical protein
MQLRQILFLIRFFVAPTYVASPVLQVKEDLRCSLVHYIRHEPLPDKNTNVPETGGDASTYK